MNWQTQSRDKSGKFQRAPVPTVPVYGERPKIIPASPGARLAAQIIRDSAKPGWWRQNWRWAAILIAGLPIAMLIVLLVK